VSAAVTLVILFGWRPSSSGHVSDSSRWRDGGGSPASGRPEWSPSWQQRWSSCSAWSLSRGRQSG